MVITRITPILFGGAFEIVHAGALEGFEAVDGEPSVARYDLFAPGLFD
jgi:hypothetical protein